MADLAAAFGLMLVFEGLLWALGPDFARRMLVTVAATPDKDLARAGWVAVGLGALVVWLVRG